MAMIYDPISFVKLVKKNFGWKLKAIMCNCGKIYIICTLQMLFML